MKKQSTAKHYWALELVFNNISDAKYLDAFVDHIDGKITQAQFEKIIHDLAFGDKLKAIINDKN